MDERAQDMIENWRDGESADVSTGRADAAFLARVRREHHRRRRPVIAIIGVATALAACALLAFVLFPTSPSAAPTPNAPVIADAEPVRPVQEWIEPSAATLATLTRLNASGDLDALVLSRADCVAWTRTVSPLGQ
jgi:hypothetical protein